MSSNIFYSRTTKVLRAKSIAVLFAFILLHVSSLLHAQIGGRHSFQFLNAPVAARMGGLGGVNVSLADHDVNFFYSNPALNGDTLAQMASANYQFFVGDISHTALTYAHNVNRVGMMTFGVQHVGYGTIEGFDDTGAALGDFNANETAIYVSKSHQVGYYRIGASLKGVFSNLAGYRSSALALDLGGVFIHPDKRFTAGIVLKNIGFVLSDYSATASSTLPFDVQAGTTFKPEHMPLRFSLTAFNLVTPDATYDDPADETDDASGVKRVLNHVNFGAEVLFHRNVNALIGYNFLNHQALKLSEGGGGGAGVTLGLVIRIKAFEFVVSRAGYVAGQATYAFTLTGNMQKLLKRV